MCCLLIILNELASTHRLSQHPVRRNNKKNFASNNHKADEYFRQTIFNSLKHLKIYNETLNLKPKDPGYVYVTELLPCKMQLRKKTLIPIFQKATEEGKKTHRKLYCVWAQ